MKAYNEVNHNPLISRAAALLLSILLLFRFAWPFAIAEASGLIDNSSSAMSVYFEGAEIYDGMEINLGGNIEARSTFTAKRGELAGLEGTVTLPERLVASYLAYGEPKTIYGTDSHGNKLDVGTWAVDEKDEYGKKFTVSFHKTLVDRGSGAEVEEESENSANTPESTESSGEENADGESAAPESAEFSSEESKSSSEESTKSNGEENSDNEPAAPESTESEGGQHSYIFRPELRLLNVGEVNAGNGDVSIDPDEFINVVLAIPITIDLDGLIPNADGSYNVAMVSGGSSVTVTVTLPQLGMAAMPLAAGATQGVTAVASDGSTFRKVVTITDIQLTDVNGNPLSSVVNKTASFRLIYDFSMSRDQAYYIKSEMSKGNIEYSVYIPETLQLPAGTDIAMPLTVNIKDNDDTTNVQYGVLYLYVEDDTLSPDYGKSKAKIVFRGDFWNKLPEYYYVITRNFEGGFQFNCDLSDSAKASTDPVLIELSQENTFTLTTNTTASPDTIAKKGVYNSTDNTITWTVTYKTGSTARDLPITLTDTFDSRYQDYKAGSLTAKYGNSTIVTGLNPTSPPVGGTQNDSFTYVLSSAGQITGLPAQVPINTTIVFTYTTTVTPEYFKNSATSSSNLKNHAEINPSSDTAPALKTDATPTPSPNKYWVSKSGTASEIVDGEINWSVTIDTKAIAIKDLVFYDLIAKGLEVKGSIAVTDSNGATYNIATDATTYTKDASTAKVPTNTTVPSDLQTNPDYDKGIGPTILEIDLNTLCGGGVNNYAKTYTIQYTTKVDPSYYIKNFNPTFPNTAWIDFTFPDNEPSTKLYYSYRRGTNTGIGPGNTQIVTKNGVYSESGGSHDITWTITVNPHEVDVRSGIVTDTLPDYLTYKNNSMKITLVATPSNTVVYSKALGGGTSTGDGTEFFSGQTFTYNVADGALGTNKLVIEFVTSVNETVYKDNQTKSVPNTVHFDGTVNFNGVPTVVVDNYTTNLSIPITMVSKAASGTYDYKNKTATWMITVNGNATNITGVKLEDYLPSYLTVPTDANGKVVPGSVVVKHATDGTTYAEGTDYTLDWKENVNDAGMEGSNKLTVNFPDNKSGGTGICYGQKVFVYINTKVDVDKLENLRDGDTSATIINLTAKLTFDLVGHATDTEESGSATHLISNTMLGKAHVTGYNATTNTIKYQVKANPVQLNLNGCDLTDTIPPELRLDVGSVKLYYAEVSAAGALSLATPNPEVVPSNKYTWRHDVDANKLIVKMPDEKRAFILEYECYVINYKSSITNMITLSGKIMGADFTGVDTVNVGASAWARGVTLTTKTGLKIVKVDSASNTPIKGITFTLYQDGISAPADRQTTDENGELVFSMLRDGLTYRLAEELDPYYDNATAKVTLENNTILGQALNVYSFKATNNQIIEISIANSPKKNNTPGGVIIAPRKFNMPSIDTPITPILVGPTIPIPTNRDHTVVLSEDGKIYIELDENGNPVGEWRKEKNKDGFLVWTYTEYSSETEIEDKINDKTKDKTGNHPDTGDSGTIFFWILSFYTSTAVLIALLWTRKKKKPWRKI